MREVLYEMRGGGEWRKLASLTSSEPPASVSSWEPTGRQVYIMGWLPTGEGPALWRSLNGADFDASTVAKIVEGQPIGGRWVVSEELELIADLEQGPHEFNVIHARYGLLAVRVRLEEA